MVGRLVGGHWPPTSRRHCGGSLKIAAMSAAQKVEMGKKGHAFIQTERSYAVLAENFLRAVQGSECF
jgi:hypothetical protein